MEKLKIPAKEIENIVREMSKGTWLLGTVFKSCC
jgi:hypothetical protein